LIFLVSGDRVSSPKGGFPGLLSPDLQQDATGGVMSKIKLNWITGKRLLKRWNIDIRELDICIKSGLPVYNPDFKLEE
jgi:hypothetical protein